MTEMEKRRQEKGYTQQSMAEKIDVFFKRFLLNG